MKVGGFWLIATGAVIALASLFMPTSIETSVPDIGGSLYGLNLPRTGNVYNLGLLQNQLMVFIAGCSIAAMGAATAAAGVVLDALPKTGGDTNDEEPIKAPTPSLPSTDAVHATTTMIPLEESSGDNEMYWVVGIAAALMLVVFVMALASQSNGNSTKPGDGVERSVASPTPGNATGR